MERIIVEKCSSLTGEIKIGGDKNSVVALIPAAILGTENITLTNVPEILDVYVLQEILKELNIDTEFNDGTLNINPSNSKNVLIEEELAGKLRASSYFMGALLAKFNKVEIALPGGCTIGSRPIDIHLEGFKKLGATITETGNVIKIEADELIGDTIDMRFPSVGATINIMYAAVFAKGTTTINNAAKEPQISDVAKFLNNMGADIKGAGTETITINGVEKLTGTNHHVISDRIEGGTYLIIGALLGKNLEITNITPSIMTSLIDALKKANVSMEINETSILVNACDNILPIDIKTEVYPGFPTDLQQPLTALLLKANGISTINETIYENRFQHIEYLNKMGANIYINDRIATIHGNSNLNGTDVIATDLRGGVTVLIAGLLADGETRITEIKHILRGYEKIIEKLQNVGAKIRKETI